MCTVLLLLCRAPCFRKGCEADGRWVGGLGSCNARRVAIGRIRPRKISPRKTRQPRKAKKINGRKKWVAAEEPPWPRSSGGLGAQVGAGLFLTSTVREYAPQLGALTRSTNNCSSEHRMPA